MATIVTDDNFEDLVINSDKPCLLVFWADWCNPCKMIGPFIEELHGDYQKIAIVAKTNAENNPEIAKRYNISHVPALLFFKDGKLVDRQAGPTPARILAEKLNQLLR